MTIQQLNMDRLDFLLPDFVRVSWIGDQARKVWEPRISRISAAWLEIEWRAVLAGVRECSFCFAAPEEYIEKSGQWIKYGLTALPVAMHGTQDHSYTATNRDYKPGQPFVYRVVVGSPNSVSRLKHAYDEDDETEIGRLLGYPSCCQAFFLSTWVSQQMVDTTWPMALADARNKTADLIELKSPPEANILWRWLGVRAVSHLPCSFHCKQTIEKGQQLIAVGNDCGFTDEMKWLGEILSWPVQWSALHGIAEIKTPVLKVSTRTDATSSEYVLQYQGQGYPKEGGRGIGFPFKTAEKKNLTESKQFKRGLENPIHARPEKPDWTHLDNGFSSQIAMDQAHEPIVQIATALVKEQQGNVLDLGCGNGMLLRKICALNPGLSPWGIDSNADPIAHSNEIHPDHSGQFIAGNMFDNHRIWNPSQRYCLAMLMPGRLLEVDVRQAQVLKEHIRRCCEAVLVYAYGDWLTRYGGLQGLAEASGITLLSIANNSTASLAKIN